MSSRADDTIMGDATPDEPALDASALDASASGASGLGTSRERMDAALEALLPTWMRGERNRLIRKVCLGALGIRAALNIVERARAARGTERLLPAVLREAGITWCVVSGSLDPVPRTGPLIVVANHPFGMAEGIILHEMARAIRDDARTMAVEHLGIVEELHGEFIFVDAFKRPAALRANVRPLVETMRWLAGGRALCIFPAGAISRPSLRDRGITDPPWSPTLGALVRRSGATVVPVYFHGRNSLPYHAAGLIYSGMRGLLVAGQLLNKRGVEMHAAVGRPIEAQELTGIGDDAAVATELRRRTLALAAAGR